MQSYIKFHKRIKAAKLIVFINVRALRNASKPLNHWPRPFGPWPMLWVKVAHAKDIPAAPISSLSEPKTKSEDILWSFFWGGDILTSGVAGWAYTLWTGPLALFRALRNGKEIYARKKIYERLLSSKIVNIWGRNMFFTWKWDRISPEFDWYRYQRGKDDKNSYMPTFLMKVPLF